MSDYPSVFLQICNYKTHYISEDIPKDLNGKGEKAEVKNFKKNRGRTWDNQKSQQGEFFPDQIIQSTIN